ncbi:signal transduction histidine kinase [Candidatus Magnetobacterium bavaricum]|uniref:Signal transduction histidine kinase n=1 Tax=Candidatus Magnetobacterium bavaricum TaxID=29290 RepID=A0A0F3GX58_9BACT|nr:signal transduction histidine kinase [Candidatus Magnetobacterium bavaricum]
MRDIVRKLKEISKDITVLFVEDDESLSRIMSGMLSKHFDTVTCMLNGQEGLDQYKIGKHDIVITDIRMPVMNGIEMTKRIREINNEQIIIVTSAYNDSQYLMELIEINVNYFILKPVDTSKLYDVLYMACKRIVNDRQLDQWHKHLEEAVQQRTIQLSEANDLLSASLTDKAVLLKEVHHRVKNNLQIISSLLSLQADTISDKHLLGIFMDSQQRIRSMALIHEKLYQSADMSKLNFAQYIEELTTELLQSYSIYNSSTNVQLDLDIGIKMLDVDVVVPCALVICELVSNSLKYAFSIGQEGRIHIRFTKTQDDKFELIVGDNGVGLPENMDIKKLSSLGMQLVYDLVTRKLKGSIDIDRTKGTSFKMLF